MQDSSFQRFLPTVRSALPLQSAVTDLRIAVEKIERLLAALPHDASHNDLEDHRTECVAELLDAMDKVSPGLGTRAQAAMYPGVRHQRLSYDRRATVITVVKTS
jgi:hypothetical protein